MIEFFALDYRAEFLISVTLRESGHPLDRTARTRNARSSGLDQKYPLRACAAADWSLLICIGSRYRWLDDATLPALKDPMC